MQHLTTKMIDPVPFMNPVLCLSIDPMLSLQKTSSVPATYQLDVLLFIALREKTPLSIRQTIRSESLAELVYIEEVDFQSRELTLFHLNDSSLSHHRYTPDDSSLPHHPQLLLNELCRMTSI